MAEPIDNLRHAMEDEAAAFFLYPDATEELSLASMAISLKRIADALTHQPDASSLNIRDLLSNIEMNGRRN